MKQITAIVIGAGGRGTTYASYALSQPEELKIVGVADPDTARRNRLKQEHQLEDTQCFNSWEEILSRPKLADCAIIATQDDLHTKPALLALQQGYHLLLEKPIAQTLEQCNEIAKMAQKTDRIVSVCHVLRYTSFYQTIKQLLDSGAIGSPISMLLRENIGYYHYAHSYVRGNWRREEANPILLAKSCHDLDLIAWLSGGSTWESISSSGALTHFTAENAPKGAPKRCTDKCPHRGECPYDVTKLYPPDGLFTRLISVDQSPAAIEQELQTGPYGRCVYHCDNNVLDHQIVTISYQNGLTAMLELCAFTPNIQREIYISGTRGELRGMFGEKHQIQWTDFLTGKTSQKDVTPPVIEGYDSHGGGDFALMKSFVQLLAGETDENETDIQLSLQSHQYAFAAEESRKMCKTVSNSHQNSEKATCKQKA